MRSFLGIASESIKIVQTYLSINEITFSFALTMYYLHLNTSMESKNEREEVGHAYLHTHTYKPIMKFSKGRKKINEGKRCNKNYAIILNVFIQGRKY